jgi:hypothetical protein
MWPEAPSIRNRNVIATSISASSERAMSLTLRAVRRGCGAALVIATVSGSLGACSPGEKSSIVGQPLRVGDTTYYVTDAEAMEWMLIEPEHPDTEPEAWRPATLFMRKRQFVPAELADADVWLSVSLEVFSDTGPRMIAKEDVKLVGGDGETYTAVFVRDMSRGGDAPPWLPDVVASAASESFITTEPYPHGGPGSVAIVEAVFGVPSGATRGATLRIAGVSAFDSGAIRLGSVPFAPSDGGPLRATPIDAPPASTSGGEPRLP